jgi:hypothetical protein
MWATRVVASSPTGLRACRSRVASSGARKVTPSLARGRSHRHDPYHGGFGASLACTRDHSRHTFSCKSAPFEGPEKRRETSCVSFLMCPLCVRGSLSVLTTKNVGRGCDWSRPRIPDRTAGRGVQCCAATAFSSHLLLVDARARVIVTRGAMRESSSGTVVGPQVAESGRRRSAPPIVRTAKPMPLRSSAMPTTKLKSESRSAM